MKLFQNVTIAFFVFLTLSIGIVSANSLVKSIYAQSNTLAQNGGGNAGQDIAQSQTSNQDNQVVSGDSNILSGNNLLCQNQDNSQFSDGICNSGQADLPPNGPTAKLIVDATVKDGQCMIAKSCTITITYGPKLITQSVTHSMLFDIDIPIDSRFAITVTSFGPLTASVTNSDCEIFSTEPYFQCRGIKNSQTTQLTTIFFSR
ncbi:MAG: hypothetical protein P0116_04825 [Candidatus Nitrosocosmicus sp.]|nr:hypothetical protein [Candidatus Nitrosocosmicus sp.]